MENWGWNQSSLPDDVALNILALLQVEDLCSLGTCSKFFREFCGSDCLWVSLYRERWSSSMASSSKQSSMAKTMIDNSCNPPLSPIKGWRSFYMERHNEMACRATSIIKVVDQCTTSQSLEVGAYQKAIAYLHEMELGFKDVVMFLFASKHNALLNLVGLHYLVFLLGVQVDYVVEALGSCHISEQQVCVRWWTLGRRYHGYRTRDESYTRKVSLVDLALAKEEEVLGVLERGAIHEVLRVQISVPDTTCVPWTCRYAVTRS